jgi:hypothetical protein
MIRIYVTMLACCACTIGPAADRELARCTSLDGTFEVTVVEPAGQWQDQFIHIEVKGPNGVLQRQMGFAAGRVNGVAWSVDGRAALTSGLQPVPRVWIDIVGQSISEPLPYGEAPLPLSTWSKICEPNKPASP